MLPEQFLDHSSRPNTISFLRTRRQTRRASDFEEYVTGYEWVAIEDLR
jgi:hypothetical protein